MSPIQPAGRSPLPASLGRWIPRPEGLSEDDWRARHTLLIWILAALVPLELLIAAADGLFTGAVLGWTATIAVCCLAAAVAPGRRTGSTGVALGMIAGCAGLITAMNGHPEAHYALFVAVAALALYRDWTPFLVFLIGTVGRDVLARWMLGAGGLPGPMSAPPFGQSLPVHPGEVHPLRWALIDAGFVLAAALMQLLSWRLAEVEQQRAARRLADAERQFTAAYEEAPVAIVLSGPDGEPVRANRSLARMMGAESDAVALAEFRRLFEDERVEAWATRLRDGQMDGGETELVRELPGGGRQHLEVLARAVRDERGELRTILVHVTDETESRTHEEALRRQVREDPLTKLLSRPAFEADLRDMLALYGSASLVLIDISRFSAMNDTYGREACDSVLCELAQRLTALVPASSLVSRISGDQFVVAVPIPELEAEELAYTMIDECTRPFEVVGGTLELAVIAGVSRVGEVLEVEHALSGAEIAAGQAKKSGSLVQVYDETLHEATRRRIAAEAMLRDALAGDRQERLPVWFQPIVNLDDGTLVGAEALIRMRSVSGELIPPGDFIPIAEETGLVIELGEYVLQESLRQLMSWQGRLRYVSVNVSPRQLAGSDFVALLARLLRESGLTDPSRLVLEITETSLLSHTRELRQRLDAIKSLGVRIALDDFGTGFSSLTWLQQVPADLVKLDRSFVAGVASDPSKLSIISALIWLTQSLNMTVVAEGVEDPADADALVRSDCPLAQGYLFSRPVPPADFEQLLDRGVIEAAALAGT